MLNRRELLLTTAAIPVALSLPMPTVAAPTGRWYAVSGCGEVSYPYWATSVKEAAISHALNTGETLGDDCPECGEIECTEHIDPKNWGEPQPQVEVSSPKSWDHIGPEKEPTNAQWMKAGYNVPCENCDYGEPEECYLFENQTVCTECLEKLRSAKLDKIIGNNVPCGLFEPRL